MQDQLSFGETETEIVKIERVLTYDNRDDKPSLFRCQIDEKPMQYQW